MEPVLKLNASPNRFSHMEGRDDKNHQVLFLVRMKTTLDAQRLRRRFHRQVWEERSRSFAFQGGIAKLAELHEHYAQKDARRKMELAYEEGDEYFEEDREDMEEEYAPRYGSRSSNAPRPAGRRGSRDSEPEKPPLPPLEPGEVRKFPPKRVIEVQIMF